jgi:hypothetical protein
VVDGKLQLQTSDGLRALSDRLTLAVGGCEPVQLTVNGSQIRIQCGESSERTEKDNLRGSADRLARIGPDGATLVLEGNARLQCLRRGKKAEVATDRITVNLTTGHMENELGAPQVQPVIVPAVEPSRPASPIPGPATLNRRSSKMDSAETATWLLGFFR